MTPHNYPVYRAASENNTLPDTAIRGACWGTAELLRITEGGDHAAPRP